MKTTSSKFTLQKGSFNHFQEENLLINQDYKNCFSSILQIRIFDYKKFRNKNDEEAKQIKDLIKKSISKEILDIDSKFTVFKKLNKSSQFFEPAEPLKSESPSFYKFKEELEAEMSTRGSGSFFSNLTNEDGQLRKRMKILGKRHRESFEIQRENMIKSRSNDNFFNKGNTGKEDCTFGPASSFFQTRNKEEDENKKSEFAIFGGNIGNTKFGEGEINVFGGGEEGNSFFTSIQKKSQDNGLSIGGTNESAFGNVNFFSSSSQNNVKEENNHSFFNNTEQKTPNFRGEGSVFGQEQSSFNTNSYSSPGCFSAGREQQTGFSASGGGFFNNGQSDLMNNNPQSTGFEDLKLPPDLLDQPQSCKMPCLMFNEPHIPVMLPTVASFEDDYKNFKEVIETYTQAKNLVQRLQSEVSESRLEKIRHRRRRSRFFKNDGVMSWYKEQNPLSYLSPLVADFKPRKRRKFSRKSVNPLFARKGNRDKINNYIMEKTRDLGLLEKARSQQQKNRITKEARGFRESNESTLSILDSNSKLRKQNEINAGRIIDHTTESPIPIPRQKRRNIIINFEDSDSEEESICSNQTWEEIEEPSSEEEDTLIYSIPDMKTINKMTINERKSVKNLKVFNKWGKILYLKPVDLTLINNIKDFFLIEKGVIEIYPDFEHIPPPGKGLNQPFILSFNNLFNDRSNFELRDAIRRHEDKAEILAKSLGGLFMEFDVEWNATKFYIEKL